jgi:hypothetical protein
MAGFCEHTYGLPGSLRGGSFLTSWISTTFWLFHEIGWLCSYLVKVSLSIETLTLRISLYKLAEWYDCWFYSYSSQQSGCSSTEGACPVAFLPQISVTDSSADPKLIEWLRNLHLDQGSIDKVRDSHFHLGVLSYDKAFSILLLPPTSTCPVSTLSFHYFVLSSLIPPSPCSSQWSFIRHLHLCCSPRNPLAHTSVSLISPTLHQHRICIMMMQIWTMVHVIYVVLCIFWRILEVVYIYIWNIFKFMPGSCNCIIWFATSSSSETGYLLFKLHQLAEEYETWLTNWNWSPCISSPKNDALYLSLSLHQEVKTCRILSHTTLW